MKTKLYLILILLSVVKVNYAQTAQNDMFRVEAYGTLITITPLKCGTLAIDGAVGSKLYDTSFTITGSTQFTVRQNIIGQELRFRTQTKCGDNSNSSWVSFKVIAPLGMPVKILHFSAHQNRSAVQINYHVEVTEGDAFDIQRSEDGKRWATIFYATSSTANPYTAKRSIIDFSATERNFYRIVLYEAGRVSYSNVLQVSMKSSDADVVLYDWSGTPVQKVKASRVRQAAQALRRGAYFGSDRKIYSNL